MRSLLTFALAVLIGASALSCGGDRGGAASSGGDQASTEGDEVAPVDGPPIGGACMSDDECVTTTFWGCCADRDGVCSCEQRAMSRAELDEAMEECAVEECAFGACPPCALTAEAPAPRCVSGCVLP